MAFSLSRKVTEKCFNYQWSETVVSVSQQMNMFQPFYLAANQVFSYNKTDSAKALLDALSREPEAELCRTLTIHKTKDTHQFRKCGE